MSLTLVTPPAVEPVDISDAQEQAIVAYAAETVLLARLIAAARAHVEQVTWRQLITAEYEWRLDRLCGTLYVPRPKLQSVASFQYVDAQGNTQTLDAGDYTVDVNSTPGRILPAHGKSWPTTRGHIDDVIIRFFSGYGNAGTDVPQPLIHAILMLVAFWYEQRETAAGTSTTEVPLGFDALIAPFRVYDPRVTEWL
jgi:uncharacterized phiE125 gp8 family phage protein